MVLEEGIDKILGDMPISNSDNAISVLINQNPQPIDKYFPTDTYDGIINSASYVHLDDEIRLALVSFFNILKIHNREIENLARLKERAAVNVTVKSYQNLIHEKNQLLIKLEGELMTLGIKCIHILTKRGFYDRNNNNDDPR